MKLDVLGIPTLANMSDRFFVSTGLEDSTVTLTGAEAHHLRDVLRHGVGDCVRLFDGRGTEAEGQFEAVSRRNVTLTIRHRTYVEEDRSRAIVLATAVPKGDRFRWLVEKATELGVRRLVLLRTERSTVVPSASKIQKARQTVVEALKQCGRRYLMEVSEPAGWSEFLEETSSAGRIIVADPSGVSISELLDLRSGDWRQTIVLAVGPEGGFTPDELNQARQRGASLVCLGSNILRVETAGIALVAVSAIVTRESAPQVTSGSPCRIPPASFQQGDGHAEVDDDSDQV